MNRISIVLALIVSMIALIPLESVHPVTNSTNNIKVPLESQIKNLLENPYFAPDYTCLFDAFQLHCIPGENQDCPEGFGTNEDYTCFPLRDECPPGYHSDYDDETGQCYPDTEPCHPGSIRYPDKHTEEACGRVQDVCKKYNMSLSESCFVDGRTIINFPDGTCLTNPDHIKCNVLEGYGCPMGYTIMTSANITTQKCVPLSDWDALKADRFRDVYDPNRCAKGYELDTGSYSHVDVMRISDNFGNCLKQR
jgi:hypothetical protein